MILAPLSGNAAQPPEPEKLKRRVSFTDHRHYYYDVDAADHDKAIEQAEHLAQNGDEGTDLRSDFVLWYATEELGS